MRPTYRGDEVWKYCTICPIGRATSQINQFVKWTTEEICIYSRYAKSDARAMFYRVVRGYRPIFVTS